MIVDRLTEGRWEIREGDVLDVLRELPPESVQSVVTSPPYWGLRDYKLPPTIWAPVDELGRPVDQLFVCDHDWIAGAQIRFQTPPGAAKQASNRGANDLVAGGESCRLCHAWRGCLGLEPAPALFVAHLVQVFREIRRVLRSDGTVWLNLGDSFYREGPTGPQTGLSAAADRGAPRSSPRGRNRLEDGSVPVPDRAPVPGLKPKELVGIPWRVAFALHDDGWWLRSDVVWSKPNPMPESVTDRPTRAHEFVFLLTKSERYFYDVEAVREPFVDDRNGASGGRPGGKYQDVASRHDGGYTRPPSVAGRNRRSVWTVPLDPFAEAHFATYPRKLIEPAILAGTSERGCCRECGAPWVRMLDYVERPTTTGHTAENYDRNTDVGILSGAAWTRAQKIGMAAEQTTTVGWRPTCSCLLPAGCRPDDLDVISSPVARVLTDREGREAPVPSGWATGPDRASELTGRHAMPDGGARRGYTERRGLDRPRDPDEGRRAITRYEQRHYADQLRRSPHRDQMIAESGGQTTFAHYLRTDRAGARPIPEPLLRTWIERGWLVQVDPPGWPSAAETDGCVVLDPFAGSGTTGLVALQFGRRFVGIELSAAFADMARRRIYHDAPLFNVDLDEGRKHGN